MKLTRVIFLALAVFVPTSWTIAMAADAPPADAPAKKEKKSRRAKRPPTATRRPRRRLNSSFRLDASLKVRGPRHRWGLCLCLTSAGEAGS